MYLHYISSKEKIRFYRFRRKHWQLAAVSMFVLRNIMPPLMTIKFHLHKSQGAPITLLPSDMLVLVNDEDDGIDDDDDEVAAVY